MVNNQYYYDYDVALKPFNVCNCIPRTKYVRGILWFSRRYAAASASASAFHRLRDNFRKPYRIASIFDM